MKNKTLKAKKFAKILLFGFSGLAVVFLIAFGIYSLSFSKKVYARQYIGEINFGGKTKSEASSLLDKNTKNFLNENINLKYLDQNNNKKDYGIKPSDLGIQYNIDSTVNDLWQNGRQGNIFESFWQQMKTVFRENKYNADYSLNQDSINQKISEIAGQVDNPEKDFSFVYQNGGFVLQTERKEGNRIDQTEIKNKIRDQISNMKSNEIVFSAKVYKPQVDEAKANERLKEANGILKAGALSLESGDQKFSADTGMIGSFISSRVDGDDLEINFNENKIKVFVQNMASIINIAPQNATLAVSGGKTTIFTPARTGKTLDSVQTVVDIENALSARLPDKTSTADPSKISLKVETKKPDITEDTINNLGVVELVASGTTDFKNSPSNRIHNINVGVAAINGSLIKPGEEFSTLGKLGTIDAASGYLPELVIKNNQTVPDYGGGLCQVSTTLFRATLNSGLKITERANHSYRVSYYEPPIGMDATIYDPSPDFKFVNNYSSYLLIQGHINGMKVTFDIYGTKDNRVITISSPNAYDYVSPPPTENIPSTTLPAGQTQQVQKAHQGASANFNYHVEKDGQVLQDKTFVSKYIALPEKWLVGQDQTSTPPPDSTTAPAPAPATDPQPAPAT